MLGIRWGERSETRCVGCSLSTELGEVQIRTGAVADAHGLAEALFGVIPVENYAVEDDSDAF